MKTPDTSTVALASTIATPATSELTVTGHRAARCYGARGFAHVLVVRDDHEAITGRRHVDGDALDGDGGVGVDDRNPGHIGVNGDGALTGRIGRGREAPAPGDG